MAPWLRRPNGGCHLAFLDRSRRARDGLLIAILPCEHAVGSAEVAEVPTIYDYVPLVINGGSNVHVDPSFHALFKTIAVHFEVMSVRRGGEDSINKICSFIVNSAGAVPRPLRAGEILIKGRFLTRVLSTPNH